MIRTEIDVLLSSGGVDSTALAAISTPAVCLFIDYGQRPARGELTSLKAVSGALGCSLECVALDASELGSGILAGKDSLAAAPSPEWWPYRNQLLITIGAAWALPRGYSTLATATVADDALRHADGTDEFYRRIDELTAGQEGGIRVLAPAIHISSVDLVKESGLDRRVLGWTHSCHSSNIACGQCPGCLKRAEVLATVE